MTMHSLATVLTLSLLCLIEASGNLTEPQPQIFKVHGIARVEKAVTATVGNEAADKVESFINTSLSQVYEEASSDIFDKTIRKSVGVTYRNPKRLSKSASCKYCVSSKCQSINKISSRITYCFGIKKRLSEILAKDKAAKGKKRSGYSNALMMTCFQNYCKTFRAHEFLRTQAIWQECKKWSGDGSTEERRD